MRPTFACMLASALLLAAVPAGAFFSDSDYHEVVLFEWDTAHLDVLVLPPVAPYAVWRLDAIHESIDAWAAGIADTSISPAWLANGVEIVRYTPGVDLVPPAGFELDDPEIIVTLSTEPGAIGIGVPWDYFVCDTSGWQTPDGLDLGIASPLPPSATSPAGFDLAGLQGGHQHEGSPWRVVSGPFCESRTENVCLVISTNWQTYQNGMYDLVSHEFGHCLGIGHVGDAGDFSAANYPDEDIMSYQHTWNKVHCVSTLNILALRVSFAPVISGSSVPPLEYPVWDPSGFPYVEQTSGSYDQTSCANPTPAPLPDTDWFPLS